MVVVDYINTITFKDGERTKVIAASVDSTYIYGANDLIIIAIFNIYDLISSAYNIAGTSSRYRSITIVIVDYTSYRSAITSIDIVTSSLVYRRRRYYYNKGARRFLNSFTFFNISFKFLAEYYILYLRS